MAPFWALLLVQTSLAKANVFSRGHLASAAVACAAAQFGWLYLSGRWYGRRYGVVREPDFPVASGLISILHPPITPRRTANRRYGYLSDTSAVLSLVWTLALVPAIFLGHNADSSTLAMLVTAYQVLPRCLYPVTSDRFVLLRRILAVTAVSTILGTDVCYVLNQIGVWTCMTVLLSCLLLLDFFDHWLLNHLLGSGFKGDSHEE